MFKIKYASIEVRKAASLAGFGKDAEFKPSGSDEIRVIVVEGDREMSLSAEEIEHAGKYTWSEIRAR